MNAAAPLQDGEWQPDGQGGHWSKFYCILGAEGEQNKAGVGPSKPKSPSSHHLCLTFIKSEGIYDLFGYYACPDWKKNWKKKSHTNLYCHMVNNYSKLCIELIQIFFHG